MKRLLCLFLIIIPAMLSAREAPCAFSDGQKKLIFDLYSRGMFREASREVERLAFYNQALTPDEWNFFMAVCMYRAGDYSASLGINNNRGIFRNGMLVSRCYYHLTDYEKAYNSLGIFSYGISEKDSWWLLSGRVDAAIQSGNYEIAIEETRRYREIFQDSQRALTLAHELEKNRNLYAPSSWKAAGLSAIVPGSGQVYSGRWKDGLLSFAAVTLAAGATALCFMNGQADFGWTFGFFTGLFYSGTIYGAWNSAAERTLSERAQFNRMIRESYIAPYEPDSFVHKDKLFD